MERSTMLLSSVNTIYFNWCHLYHGYVSHNQRVLPLPYWRVLVLVSFGGGNTFRKMSPLFKGMCWQLLHVASHKKKTSRTRTEDCWKTLVLESIRVSRRSKNETAQKRMWKDHVHFFGRLSCIQKPTNTMPFRHWRFLGGMGVMLPQRPKAPRNLHMISEGDLDTSRDPHVPENSRIEIGLNYCYF